MREAVQTVGDEVEGIDGAMETLDDANTALSVGFEIDSGRFSVRRSTCRHRPRLGLVRLQTAYRVRSEKVRVWDTAGAIPPHTLCAHDAPPHPRERGATAHVPL